MRTPARDSRLEETTPDDAAAGERHREERLPMLAIVGRPNVGKSTLFNRLVRGRHALVHERPGMTRDRRIERVEWNDVAFLCVDTGGFDTDLDDPLLENVVAQARLAMAEADAILFLSAAGEHAHPAEEELIGLLRQSRKPVLYAVNKCDNPALELDAHEFYRWGFETIHAISALHGRGVADLLDAAIEELDKAEPAPRHEYSEGGIAVAIVGRQNVGKSSLINRLVGEERVIASELPGTTRDAIDTVLKTEAGDLFTLIDTAGIRRRGKVERGVEKLCVLSSMIAIRRADVAAIVIDASQGLIAQDAHVASYCVDEGCACLIVVNKWDLVEKDHRTADEFTKTLNREWPFLRYAPVVYTSAESGQRVVRILEIARAIYRNADRRIPTPALNELLAEWVRRKPPPIRRNRQPKIKYIAQTGVHPPTFTLWVNDPRLLHFSYKRHLANRLRENFDFEGTPLRLFFKAKGKPEHEDAPAAKASDRS